MKLSPVNVLAVVMSVMVLAAEVRAGGCTDWLAGPLDDGQAPSGTDGPVFSAMAWDPDQGGPETAALVIGGDFDLVQGTHAGNIARRDGATGQWTELGGVAGWFGQSAKIFSTTLYNGELFLGGAFALPTENIARWDGEDVQNVGYGLEGSVFALTVYNGELIAAGSFNQGSQQGALTRIARWNGTIWQPLGSGISGGASPFVAALAVYNGELYAGGVFTAAGGQAVNNIARWNGTAWQSVGAGVAGSVNAFTGYNGKLGVGGGFTSAGGTPAANIALWNGSSWQPVGAGTNNPVLALSVYNSELIAGGYFTQAGGAPAGCIARWNGASWQTLGTGITGPPNPSVKALAVVNGELIAGGFFSNAGGQPANYLAKWNGGVWSKFGGGTLNSVQTMVNYGSRVIAGGEFLQSTSVGQAANHIVSFDGVGLKPLGSGMNGAVNSLMSFTQADGDRELVAGGFFTTAGGTTANHVSRWIEDPLIGFPPPQWQAMGNGFNGGVQSLTRFNGRTVAGGYFTTSANGATTFDRIARWNDNTSTWDPMGTGMNGLVAALEAYNVSASLVRVVAGGYFNFADGVSANYIVAWTENTQFPTNPSWVQLGSGFNNAVLALEHHNGSLYAGGAFTASGSTVVNRIARWNTALNPDAWVAVGNGIGFLNGNVTSLKSYNGMLYAGGNFTSVDGQPSAGLAVWDGTQWSDVQGGATSAVTTLVGFNNELHVGGTFDAVENNSLVSPGWGKFLLTGAPWIALPPQTAGFECGGTAFFSVFPAPGYSGLQFQWQKNGVPLANGPTGSGSVVLESANDLTIDNISPADAGDYTVVVSNACGSVTSFPATLTIFGECSSGPDIDGNGVVDIDDLFAVIGAWGSCAGCPEDIDGDGLVNIDDLFTVIAAWGPVQ